MTLASEGNVHDDYRGNDDQDDQDQVIKQYLVIKSYFLISSDLDKLLSSDTILSDHI